jgi:IS1 family transposase
VLELDGLCSFVGQKANERWVWLAKASHTRQVLTYVIAAIAAGELPEGYGRGSPKTTKRGCCYSDFREAYREVIPEERHEAVGKERAGSWRTWRGGTTPCASVRHARSERGFRPPSPMTCTRYVSEALRAPLQYREHSISTHYHTKISIGPVAVRPHHPRLRAGGRRKSPIGQPATYRNKPL